MSLAPSLKDYATNRQIEIIDALEREGSHGKAAAALGIHKARIGQAIKAVKRRAALHGWAPEADLTRPVPEPLVLRGTSTLYDQAGVARLQWVKTRLDETKARAAIEEWVTWLTLDAKGLAPVTPAPTHCTADLLAVYVMGDPHFGMYAWDDEAGESFDLAIAERQTYGAIDRLVSVAPAAETALILNLGDFFHADNNAARTERSGNALDVDTRWARVMQVGLRALVHCIKRALSKHKRVVVRNNKGNHDPHSSFALGLALDAYFHNEPRVEIDLSPSAFWYFRHGKVLIGSTHGDMTKPQQLPGIMAADRREEWGLTEFRYWYQGHLHHSSKYKDEYPGCEVEIFRTMAARDAWHAAAGYRSRRDMTCIVHHRNHGEIERHRCDVSMLAA